jgi:hypothetical protein
MTSETADFLFSKKETKGTKRKKAVQVVASSAFASKFFSLPIKKQRWDRHSAVRRCQSAHGSSIVS